MIVAAVDIVRMQKYIQWELYSSKLPVEKQKTDEQPGTNIYSAEALAAVQKALQIHIYWTNSELYKSHVQKQARYRSKQTVSSVK